MPCLKRFIDDMLGIWCGTDDKWELFKDSLDGFRKLKWITSDRASQVTFLDLTITIDPSSRHTTTKTYQKPQNLHVYIPRGLFPRHNHGESHQVLDTKLQSGRFRCTDQAIHRQIVSPRSWGEGSRAWNRKKQQNIWMRT
jgi:hypothetical protein